MQKIRGIFAFLFLFVVYISDSSAVETDLFPKDKLTIKTSSLEVSFNIEIAATGKALSQGLMFRKKLSEKSGMLFLFGDQEQTVKMWMKNTYIPLDMIFINRTGTIVSIAKNTVPKSLAQISSAKPALAALEVNAGITDRYGIKVGDKIIHNAFIH